MSIWNKVLVGLIGVASLVFFFMAARTLKTHQHWRQLAAKYEQKVDQVQQDKENLVKGAGEQLGIRQLRVELNKLLLDRRRVWSNCESKGVSGQGDALTVTLAITQPDSSGIAANTILYGFDQADVEKNGRYLGAFKVTRVDEQQKQVVLTPASQLSASELDRLAAAKGPWVLYEAMPRDNHDVFASLSDEQKKALLPADSLAEYLKDGKPATKDDPAGRVVDGTYVRSVRDYQVLLNAQNVARTLLIDQMAAATCDVQLVEDALAKANAQKEALEKALVAVNEEVKEFTGQRETVVKYRTIVEGELAAVKATIDGLMQANQDMASKIAARQLEAARRIDDRTRDVARSGGTGGL